MRARLELVGTPEAVDEATKAAANINALLREDNASASLRVKNGAQIIHFPGCKTPLADEAVVHETGKLTGTVISVGGKDETVPLWL